MSCPTSNFDPTAEADRELLADGVLSIPGAIAFAGGVVHRTTLFEAMARGDLRSVRVGRRRGIPKRELVDYLASRLEPAAR